MQDKYTKTIAGYRLTDRLLGQGAFSQVFLAHSLTHTPLAVKIISRCDILAAEAAGFESEVEVLRGLRHENIVRLIDFHKSQNNFYLFLEYCEGGSLAEYIKKKRTIPEKQALKIFKQIILGVSTLHQFKIIHRDLKPANILLSNDKVKIADFGFACKFKRNEMMRTYAGTPFHMAPQMLRGYRYSHKVDVYSAGTVLYEMLYGAVPFKGKDTLSLLEAIQNEKILLQNPEVQISKRTQNLLREMLTPQPQDRIEMTDILDIVISYERDLSLKKLEEYRVSSLNRKQFFAAPGGISCAFEFNSERGEINEMDQRLYSRLCRKLSAEVLAQ